MQATLRSVIGCILKHWELKSSNAREQNLRLSRTVFIVVVVSLVVWLPAFVVFGIIAFFRRCSPPRLVWSANALHLANSMVNPFVYSFRMPVFKVALKKLWRKRRKTIELRTLPENQERNFDGITKCVGQLKVTASEFCRGHDCTHSIDIILYKMSTHFGHVTSQVKTSKYISAKKLLVGSSLKV